jgi:hypothetical protein
MQKKSSGSIIKGGHLGGCGASGSGLRFRVEPPLEQFRRQSALGEKTVDKGARQRREETAHPLPVSSLPTFSEGMGS